MNNNLTKNHIKLLRAKYEEAVAAYLVTLGDLWDIDVSTGYWVSDDVIYGGIWCYGETIFMNVDEIITCVEYNLSYDAFTEYLDYNVWAIEFGFDKINLQSWINGAPRADAETMERISRLKRELDEVIEKSKNSLKKIL